MHPKPNASFRKGSLVRTKLRCQAWHTWSGQRAQQWYSDLQRAAACAKTEAARFAVLFDDAGEPRIAPFGEWVDLPKGHIVHVVRGRVAQPRAFGRRSLGGTVLVLDFASGSELFVPRVDLEPVC